MTERRFTRFQSGAASEAEGRFAVPDDGLCLSTFLILHPLHEPGRVLLGRVDPRAPWDQLGSLDAARIHSIAQRWMLPSSQLLFFESPAESAHRIAKEQLESPLPPMEGPLVFSEQYRRPSSTGRDAHWDLHFIFSGTWPTPDAPKASPWLELAFLTVAETSRTEIARSQGDILDLAGLSPRD